MPIKKKIDWQTWIAGFYDSWVDAVVNGLLAWGGSAAAGQVPGLESVVLNWKQAIGITMTSSFSAILRYWQAHKRPAVIVTTSETTFKKVEKDGSSQEVSRLSTITTTPPEAKPDK